MTPSRLTRLMNSLSRLQTLSEQARPVGQSDLSNLTTLASDVLQVARDILTTGNSADCMYITSQLKAMRLPLPGLDLLRGQTFLHLGQTGAAREALKEEIRYFPNNQEAKKLFLHIDKADSVVIKANDADEFLALLKHIRLYTMIPPQRLYCLFMHAKQICRDDLPGNFVECGVAAGGSSALLAYVIKKYSKRKRLLYAFDSFEGLPAPTEADTHVGVPADVIGWGPGTCAAPEESLGTIARKLEVQDIIKAVKGYFQDTLPCLKDQIDRIALLHMDGDWYESTMDILINLYDKVIDKGYIQVDDYGHWDGCKKALHDFENNRELQFCLNKIDSAGVWFMKAQIQQLQQTTSLTPKERRLRCPLTGSTNIHLEKTIYVSEICDAYLNHLKIDVSQYFSSHNKIFLYKNIETKFQFYYPFRISGDSLFYEQLSANPWYYMDWKWEHQFSQQFILQDEHILEIGCAKGNFLKTIIQQNNSHAVGLELNTEAAMFAQNNNIEVYQQSIDQHAINRRGVYDVVCAFQVIEHIHDVSNFLNRALYVLKKSGKLIISVPNQDSFIGLDDFSILDMPPHHVNKWNEQVLRSLESILPIKLLSLEFEPLQKYHLNYFASIVRKKFKNDYHLQQILIDFSQKNSEQIRGHTVLAVYEKTSDE